MASAKEKRYDRQLRLWGDNGQEQLEKASVCMIGSDGVACEILKNLALPGVGSFVIVDDKLVSHEDLGNNFFLTPQDLFKPRAQAVLPNLLELNEEVSGQVANDSLQTILTEYPQFFKNFDVIIVTEGALSLLQNLSQLLYEWDIPLLTCLSTGLWGFFHLSLREHCIVESHPDYNKPDLRLDQPFPGLQQFCDSQKLDEMDLKTHAHTPWLILLMKQIQRFRLEHNGKFPATYEEKKLIKSWITSDIHEPDSSSGIVEEENFTEAINAVNVVLTVTSIPSCVKDIMNTSKCLEASTGNQNDVFWILVAALKRFVTNKGHLPICGSLPDMTSDSQRFIQLQRLYQTQAQSDCLDFQFELDDILGQLNKREKILIPDATIRTFCKNAANLKVIKNSAFHDVWFPSLSDMMESLAQPSSLETENSSGEGVTAACNASTWFMALRAAFQLQCDCGHWPGVSPQDSLWMRRWCIQWLPRAVTTSGSGGSSPTSSNLQALWDCIEEICRCSPGGALHTVAAFLGGAVAQEAIKVITKQYVPISAPMIYNAMQHDCVTLNF